jgi:Fe-S cluster biogenesis protein NfuA
MRLQIGDILNYNGACLTCTDVQFTTPDGSVAEDNLEYTFENDSAIVTFRDDEVTRFLADGAEVIRD